MYIHRDDVVCSREEKSEIYISFNPIFYQDNLTCKLDISSDNLGISPVYVWVCSVKYILILMFPEIHAHTGTSGYIFFSKL